MAHLVIDMPTPPFIQLWADAFSAQELRDMYARMEPRFVRSTVLAAYGAGSVVGESRTSDSAYFSREEGAPVLWKVAHTTDTDALRWETPQMTRYSHVNRGEFKPHHDWFIPGQEASIGALARGGQRIASGLIGIEAAEEGGETVFPQIQGFKVKVLPGMLLTWKYDKAAESSVDLHGSLPVTLGTKVVIPTWYRLNEFDSQWPDLRVVDDVFTPQQVDALIAHYATRPEREGGVDRVIRFHSPEQSAFVAPFVQRVVDVMREQFSASMNPETVVIACMPAGTQMINHADNVKWDSTQDKYVPNHTPVRTYTAVVTLDDGPGGATLYGENEGVMSTYRKTVEQKRGRMHAHKCGPNYFHSVAMTQQPRHTFIVWFKD